MGLPDFPLAFWPVATAAILVTGIAKGGFGLGSGGIAVPLMSIFIAPPEAAAIMLPILCAMDLFGVHAYRNDWSRAHFFALLPGGLAGIALGGLAFGALSVNAIRFVLGAIAILFSLNRWFRLSERIAERLAAERERPPGRAAATFWGTVAGFTSTLAHAGGPPFAVYILSQRMDKTAIVATAAVFFLVVNYVKLVPYAMLGQLNAANLTTSLVFAPLAPLGIWLGVWLHRRISDAAFYQASYALLFATGLKLIHDALR